jgi:hypothetical protein
MAEEEPEVVSLDANIEDADWTKQSWDLPPYKSYAFLELFPDLDAFRQLPVYKHAVAKGLIVDDEWAGPVSDEEAMDELASILANLIEAGSADYDAEQEIKDEEVGYQTDGKDQA